MKLLDNDGGGLFRPQADINVTPMVDVMLVLLVIFMVTAPMLATGVNVRLPQARAATQVADSEAIVISVGKDGRLSLGVDDVNDTDLIDALVTKYGDDRSRLVHLRGDKDVAYGAIVAVLDRLAGNGFTRIAIIADSRRGDTSAASKAGP